jgi:antitoxin component YwqK of YwqJK toxin-antitoxin module
MLDGLTREYWKVGVPKSELQYVNSKLNGLCSYYFQSGQKNFEVSMVDGKMTGYGKEFFEGGSLKYEGHWKYDLYHGQGSQYQFKCGITFTGEFISGEPHAGVETQYFSKVKKRSELTLTAGVVNGTDNKYYFPNGKLQFEGVIVNGAKCGPGKEWHKLNGHLMYDGGYFDDLQEGLLTKSYGDNGKLKYHGQLIAGKPVGFGRLYYNNGQIRYIGGHQNGEYLRMLNFDGVKRGEYDNYHPDQTLCESLICNKVRK